MHESKWTLRIEVSTNLPDYFTEKKMMQATQCMLGGRLLCGICPIGLGMLGLECYVEEGVVCLGA